MKEKLLIYKTKLGEYWSSRNKPIKTAIISCFFISILAIFAIFYFVNKTDMAPLYKDLTYQETGQIKEILDSRGVPYEISQNGTSILVPQELVDTIKIDLAAEGIPKSGSIDYSFFSERSGFGMTDNEFQMLKLDSTQSELENLIKSIDGVQGAKVMISMPQDGVFVRNAAQDTSVSIILDTRPGQQFDQAQINALYHLVEKSIPNLSTDNIVIMNQYVEYYDLKNSSNDNNFSITSQLDLKREIERDIQRQVHQMLGMMMGHENVVVSVTTDIDFTQENREENLVTPVDPDNMEGIAVSVERITESYTGSNDEAGGVVGTQENDVPSYVAGGATGSGDYERMEERINNDVNRIRKEIVESPYKIRDLGIQVMVNPPKGKDLLAQENTINDIRQILSTIVRTTIDKKSLGDNPTAEDIDNKIVVSLQEFTGQQQFVTENTETIPLLVYIGIAILVVIIILLLFLLFRKRREREEEEIINTIEETVSINIPDIHTQKETEGTARRKQLEKLAKEKPDEFAKLLRSWLSE